MFTVLTITWIILPEWQSKILLRPKRILKRTFIKAIIINSKNPADDPQGSSFQINLFDLFGLAVKLNQF